MPIELTVREVNYRNGSQCYVPLHAGYRRKLNDSQARQAAAICRQGLDRGCRL